MTTIVESKGFKHRQILISTYLPDNGISVYNIVKE